MDNIEILEKCAWYQEKCTGRKLTSNTYSLSDYSDFTVKEAMESLKFDESGYLAILLLRKAWREFCTRSIKIEDLLKDETKERIELFHAYNNYLSNGDASIIYKNLVDGISKLCEKFEISDYKSVFEDDSRLIDIFSEAYNNIYKKYKVDKFRCKNNIDSEPIICEKEVRTKTLQQFVNILRNSGNCIAYAKIDMVSEVDDPNDYDIFFAFGCRCGEYVYVLSDRNVDANPKARKAKMRRNPGKKLSQKAGTTYMPYYDIQANKGDNTPSKETALITIDNANNIALWNGIKDSYDLYAKLSIVISIYAIYTKYFINHTVDIRYSPLKRDYAPVEDSYFASEVKLLPGNCTALVKPEKLTLPALTYDAICTVPDSIYWHEETFYDKYVKRWCTDEDFKEIPALPDFVAPVEEIKQWAWWMQRDKARCICNERMLTEYSKHFWSKKTWQDTGELVPYEVKFRKNPETDELGDYAELNYRGWNYIEEDIPRDFMFCKDYDIQKDIGDNIWNFLEYLIAVMEYRNENDIHSMHACQDISVKLGRECLYSKDAHTSFSVIINKEENSEWRHFKKSIEYRSRCEKWSKYIIPGTSICLFFQGFNNSVLNIYLETGAKNKTSYVSFDVDSVDVLSLLMNQPKEHFPEWLREWRHYSTHPAPYTGNSLLDMTDPMESVFVPENY